MTSVTIPEELRKRLKKLAAKYDTTQGKIIEMALNLMENKNNNLEALSIKNEKVNNLLTQISERARKRNPKLKKRREILEKEGITIDEIIGYSWGSNLEDFIGQ
ncbi:MAG: hypothetical protein ACTSRS_16310 [Candidatus Helarchaeota archaeon]